MQVLVPTLSPGQIWSGPPVEELPADAWRGDPDAVRLAEMARKRTVAADALVAEAERLAEAAPAGQRNDRLALLFAGMFQSVQEERGAAIEAIRRFARSQRGLMDRIDGHLAKLEAMAPDDPERQAVSDALAWDRRVLEERRRLLPTLCESPVLLERRLGAAARALAARLE
ncbi:MAG TPA: hypothetical protein VEB20_10530 [Azospirillaceae bacterium]|nr:hypothetical protein [Azospirillaceae bacterium]